MVLSSPMYRATVVLEVPSVSGAFLKSAMGVSADPEADLKRADELLSKALALEPTNASAHNTKAWVLNEKGRFEEAIAERERTLALDPADVGAMAGMAWDQVALGQYEKGLELYDRAIRLSPRDPELQFRTGGKSWAYFGLKQPIRRSTGPPAIAAGRAARLTSKRPPRHWL